MKKKICILLITLFVIMVGVFSYTFAACSHNWVKTGSQKASCTKVGYVYFKCSKCQKTTQKKYADKTEHSYGSWTTEKSATCTSDGKKIRKCKNCSHKETKTVKALGHNYENKYSVKKVATKDVCQRQYVRKLCSRCGASTQETLDNTIKSHQFGLWRHDSSGHSRTCSKCGYIESGTHDSTKECTTCGYKPAKCSHTYGNWGYLNKTQCHRYCTKCGYEAKDNHEQSDKGGGRIVCSRCGYVIKQGDIVSHTGSHKMNYKNLGDKGHEISCTEKNCNYKTITKEHDIESSSNIQPTSDGSGHVITTTQKCKWCTYIKSATTTKEPHNYLNGVCSRCGVKDPDYKKHTHIYGDAKTTYKDVNSSTHTRIITRTCTSKVGKCDKPTEVEEYKNENHVFPNGKACQCGQLPLVKDELIDCNHPSTSWSYASNDHSTHKITCTKCGTIINPKQNHSFKYSEVPGVGTTHKVTCKSGNCNLSYTEAHVDSNKDGKCDKCGTSVKIDCDHPSTSWSYASNDHSTHKITCTKCGTIINPKQNHSFKYSEVPGVGTTHKVTCKSGNCNLSYTEAHVDSNKDGKCDKCGAKVSSSTPSDSGTSHGGNPGGENSSSSSGTPVDNTPTDKVVTVDVIGRYEGEELAKSTENATVVPTGATIDIEGSTDDDTVPITEISGAWDGGTAESVDATGGSITVPESFEPGSQHSLQLVAKAQNGSSSTKDYIIKIPADVEVNIQYNGDVVENFGRIEVNQGDPIRLYGEPEDEMAYVVYLWDNQEAVKHDGTEYNVIVPTEFAKGSTHRLTISGASKSGKTADTKQYQVYIRTDNEPSGDGPIGSGEVDQPPIEYTEDTPLQVLPWENENFGLTQLAILLRNDSEKTKSNKNMYALNEEVIYYLDYKNGGDDINEPVTLTFNVPLDFEIVDNGGGNVEGKTITWTYPNGMVAGRSGTRRVILKYTSLSKTDILAEKIYPLAKISAGTEVKDSSSVINLIYIDSNTVITSVYDNATGKLMAVHSPYMYGDADKPTFRPDDTITRAEGALVLVRILFGQDAINNAQITGRFPDLNQTYEEAQKAISVATQNGVIIGYEDGTYKPNKTMTRAEFMKILATFLSKNSVENGIEGLQLKDSSASVKMYNNPVTQYLVGGQVVTEHWAIKEVSLLYRLNMTSLNSNELDLRMDKGITRAEVAQLINFFLLRAPAESNGVVGTGFIDLSMNHKLVADIIEATRAIHNFTITEDSKEIGR